MKMTILQLDDEITHVVLDGRLDTTGADELRASFFEATAGRGRSTVVDLAGIEFMASCGIGLLIANAKRLTKSGHKMVLLNPQGLVESVLRSSKVDKLMPFAKDLDEAMRIVRGVSDAPVSVGPRLDTSDQESRFEPVEPLSTAPPAIEGELRLQIKNEHSELKGLMSDLGQFIQAHRVPHRAAYAVNLTIDELVSNVMRYAYVDDETHFIEIVLAIEGDQIILQITDDGRPFDPRTGPELDLHAEDREFGGLGILLVLEMVDALKYRRVEEKNCVEVRIHLIGSIEDRGRSETTGVKPEASDEECS
jgi:anti-anti-sigma factor